MQLKSFPASSVLIGIIGCSTQNSSVETKSSASPETSIPAAASTSDELRQRERELKETLEQNRRRPNFTKEELHQYMDDSGHKAHVQIWRNLKSFYALLEIVEGIIEPEMGRIRRQDIQELLGTGNPDYPGSHGRTLEYIGNRHLPAGAHLLIHFDETDVVDRLDWVSE